MTDVVVPLLSQCLVIAILKLAAASSSRLPSPPASDLKTSSCTEKAHRACSFLVEAQLLSSSVDLPLGLNVDRGELR